MDAKKYCRNFFMGFSIFIIVSGLICFIMGNVNFYSKTTYEMYFVYSFGFLGGHLVSLALFIMVYGFLGLYAGYKNDKVAVMFFTAIAIVSLLCRIILWVEVGAFKLDVNQYWWYYSGVIFEIIPIICGTVFYFSID